MKDRPILFSGPMVKAILECRKTQTRRVVKLNMSGRVQLSKRQWHIDDPNAVLGCPYGQPGDRLWVKETWAAWSSIDDREADEVLGNCESLVGRGISRGHISYRADPQMHADKWRPSIFMPRWASRVTLEITGVRVERLNDISEADAIAEGIDPLFTEEKINERPDLAECRCQWLNYLWHGHFGKHGMGNTKSDRWAHQFSSYTNAVGSYSSLWESINGPGSWDANPFVWVIEFRGVN